jgi:hypothetical protein
MPYHTSHAVSLILEVKITERTKIGLVGSMSRLPKYPNAPTNMSNVEGTVEATSHFRLLARIRRYSGHVIFSVAGSWAADVVDADDCPAVGAGVVAGAGGGERGDLDAFFDDLKRTKVPLGRGRVAPSCDARTGNDWRRVADIEEHVQRAMTTCLV